VIEWLRPGWLLAIPAGLALAWAWWRTRAGVGRWRGLVDAHLLTELAGRAPARSAPLALGAAVAAFIIACIALAGPIWHSQPEPLARGPGARIVVLDLSPSMDAVDVAPSRLERARVAVAALLGEAAGAKLGLVVFGADAFAVAPMTRDAATLVHLLRGLGPATLPRAGSRPDLGLELARELLESSGVAAGDVILVGDSVGDTRTLEAARALARAGFPLSVLAVGAPYGGPVRRADGGFARTDTGDVMLVVPELAGLERVARAGGGRFHLLQPDGATPRLSRTAQDWTAQAGAPAPREDAGAWLVLLALPFAALLFRRGWLMGVAALAFALPAPQAQAFEWADLWLRPDQQAAEAFARGPGTHAARLIERLEPDSPWYAALLYRSGRYAEAAARFAARDTADAHYNRGNALALEGRLEAALAAYDAALARDPAMRDALANRGLVREALARRRAPGLEGHGEQTRDRPDAAAPPETGTQALAGRRTPSPEDSRNESAWDEPGKPARSPAAGAQEQQDSQEAAELRRLEALLAKVPDDPGSLLANRFAHELRRRGPRRSDDTGARW
jgi:Ca-activated chloride channel family protein